MYTGLANYARAETAAYECLIEYCPASLPVDVLGVIKKCRRAKVMTYVEAAAALGMETSDIRLVAANDAMTIKGKDRFGETFLLLTNEEMGHMRERFTSAHELGHMILGHKSSCHKAEVEANVFAAAFLCPRAILRRVSPRRVRDVAAAFEISLAAAEIAVCNANKPDYADKDVCKNLLRHFKADERRRLEDYLGFPALANFYAARLRTMKGTCAYSERAEYISKTDRSIENMERLMEIRCDCY